jgi:flagellar motility protein MotE (MotC chaperone)
MKLLRDIRIIPVVLIAIFGFAVVKVAGLVIDGGYVFDYDPQSTRQSWAQETFNFPGGNKTEAAADITGSVDEKKEEKSREEKKEDKPKEETGKPAVAAPEVARPEGALAAPAQSPPVSPSERAILERLQSRRQELEARAREIDIRESLLKAAEKRIESKVQDMKATESRIATVSGQKTEADAAHFKGIIIMYENMKPKDAAKVFDRLEMPVLFEIASQINPRKMSDILGLMQTDAAERLTTEMARRANPDKSASAADLPKIEGKMLQQKPN